MIYTTNAVEALNRSLRKIIKTRVSFPNDEAAMKLLYLAIRNARPVAWTARDGPICHPVRRALCRLSGLTPWGQSADPANLSQRHSYTKLLTLPFETAKNEFGLDHNESRSWHGWHRHVSLVMLAFAMMAAIRHRANPPPPKKRNVAPRQKPKHYHAVTDPLVNPGNPPHCHPTRSKADLTRTHHRMVLLA